ncbi:MAG: fluoride efflux transporter CrcB [Candidatus Abyssubacteria bacterium]
MLHRIMWLALAGAAGTLARYALAGWVHRVNGSYFPWGTLAVNAAGCFLAGFLWAVFEHRWQVSGETRTIILVGFFGAFTTFSAFILESGELFRAAEWFAAVKNITFQNGLGFLALFAGTVLGRLL